MTNDYAWFQICHEQSRTMRHRRSFTLPPNSPVTQQSRLPPIEPSSTLHPSPTDHTSDHPCSTASTPHQRQYISDSSTTTNFAQWPITSSNLQGQPLRFQLNTMTNIIDHRSMAASQSSSAARNIIVIPHHWSVATISHPNSASNVHHNFNVPASFTVTNKIEEISSQHHRSVWFLYFANIVCLWFWTFVYMLLWLIFGNLGFNLGILCWRRLRGDCCVILVFSERRRSRLDEFETKGISLVVKQREKEFHVGMGAASPIFVRVSLFWFELGLWIRAQFQFHIFTILCFYFFAVHPPFWLTFCLNYLIFGSGCLLGQHFILFHLLLTC